MRTLNLASLFWAFVVVCTPSSAQAPAGEPAGAVDESSAAATADNNVAAAEESSVANSEVLDDSDDTVSDAGSRRQAGGKKVAKASAAKGKSKSKGKVKKDNTIRGEGKLDSGADREEGWVIRKAADGTYVKVPAKQTFRFEGDVSGQANRPSQSVLGQRPSYRPSTLIPERMSFRKEFLEAAGTGR